MQAARSKPKAGRSRWSRLYRRRRRARLLSILAAIAGLVVFAVAAAILVLALKPTVLTVAAGPREGIDARILQDAARRLAQDSSKVRLKLAFTESADNTFGLVSGGRADLAVVRADQWPDDAYAVAILRKSTVLIWSAGKEKPDALKEIKNARVGVIDGSPHDIVLIRQIFEQSGRSFDVAGLPSADLGKPNHGYNLIAHIAHPRGKAVRDLVSHASRPQPLPIDAAEAIVRKQPRLESDELPRGALSASPILPAEPLQTISIGHVLAASRNLSEENGAALARALFTYRPAILRDTVMEASLGKPDTEKDAAIPAHGGVAAYIDGTERTFLERYSDLFWMTILALSGLGSAGAWFRAFYYRDELDDTATMRDQLLDLVAKTRTENSLQGITAMEIKADELLRETLDRYEQGALDDGTLAAFGLALEHFRDVVRAQRIAIAAGSAAAPAARA